MKTQIVLTKEEQKEIENLTEEQKQELGVKFLNKRVQILSILSVFCTLLIEYLDELEHLGIVKSKLKIAAKPFLIQINYFINNLFKQGDDPVFGNNWINEKIEKIDKVLKEDI